MDIQVKKLGKNKWEMHLQEPVGEYVFGSDPSMQTVREAAEELGNHDNRVRLINDELVASDYTMFSRQAYDRWHWFDEQEMKHFITYFTLKHGEK